MFIKFSDPIALDVLIIDSTSSVLLIIDCLWRDVPVERLSCWVCLFDLNNTHGYSLLKYLYHILEFCAGTRSILLTTSKSFLPDETT